MTTTAPFTAAWHGWLWTGDVWQRGCAGASLGECSRRLGEEGRRRGVAWKHQVMTGGGPPTFVPYDAIGAKPCVAKGNSREDDL